MKERIFLIVGLSLLVLAIQGRLFGPQPKIKPLAVPTTITQSLDLNKDVSVVTRVVDGDTIVVTTFGIPEKVRLIGVDTPETIDSRRQVQCFGKEASNFTKSLLIGKSVRLELDPSQGDKDNYGRLLRYVFLDDLNVNKKIISEGYGHEYTYRIPYKYQEEFKNAERVARESKKGLWADGACGLSNI